MSPSSDDARVLRAAAELGIDPDDDARLLGIARDFLGAALPKGWEECETSLAEEDGYGDGETYAYFFNGITGESSWDHPLRSEYVARFEAARGGGEGVDARDSAPGGRNEDGGGRAKDSGSSAGSASADSPQSAGGECGVEGSGDGEAPALPRKTANVNPSQTRCMTDGIIESCDSSLSPERFDSGVRGNDAAEGSAPRRKLPEAEQLREGRGRGPSDPSEPRAVPGNRAHRAEGGPGDDAERGGRGEGGPSDTAGSRRVGDSPGREVPLTSAEPGKTNVDALARSYDLESSPSRSSTTGSMEAVRNVVGQAASSQREDLLSKLVSEGATCKCGAALKLEASEKALREARRDILEKERSSASTDVILHDLEEKLSGTREELRAARSELAEVAGRREREWMDCGHRLAEYEAANDTMKREVEALARESLTKVRTYEDRCVRAERECREAQDTAMRLEAQLGQERMAAALVNERLSEAEAKVAMFVSQGPNARNQPKWCHNSSPHDTDKRRKELKRMEDLEEKNVLLLKKTRTIVSKLYACIHAAVQATVLFNGIEAACP